MSRRWKTDPAHRGWGWMSDDGYEIEWRHAEVGNPAGFYLWGRMFSGFYLGNGTKAVTLAKANMSIARAAA